MSYVQVYFGDKDDPTWVLQGTDLTAPEVSQPPTVKYPDAKPDKKYTLGR